MIKLTKQQLYMRRKVAKMLSEAQDAFYETGHEKFRSKVRAYLPGLLQAKFLYPAEKRKVEFWIDFWGDTIFGNAVSLDTIWNPETSPTAPPGSTGEYSENKERLVELEAENKRLKELAAQGAVA